MASRVEQLLSAFSDALNDPSVRLLKGRKALAENRSIPRITHVPIGGDIKEPDLVGGGLLGTSVRDRIVRVRAFNFQVYVHGRDIEQAEQLLHNAIAAWELTASGSVAFSAEDWTNQQDGSADIDTRGEQISLTVTVMIPVYAAQQPLTFPRSTAQENLLTLGDLYGDGATYGNGHTYHTGDTLSVTQTF